MHTGRPRNGTELVYIDQGNLNGMTRTMNRPHDGWFFDSRPPSGILETLHFRIHKSISR
jgi:hypothetical protein